jgi:cysteine-rich repeat protein
MNRLVRRFPMSALPLAAALTPVLSSLGGPATAKPPGNWTCAEAYWEDATCDCGCGADDPDCTMSTFEGCARSGCGAGKVPWEHAPASCMSSACGDGWKDERASEVCDDGEALAGGGCSADCKRVNEGWICGERAEKCAPSPTEPAPEPGPQATAEASPEATAEAPVGEPVGPTAAGGGCGAGTPISALLGLAGFLMSSGRRRIR